MKSLILLTALFVSVPALVHAACPVLAGKYNCTDDMGATVPSITVKETEVNGVRMYKINGRAMTADGVSNTKRVVLRDGQVVNRTVTVSCTDDKLTYQELNMIEGETTAAASDVISYSLDAWGDLNVVQLLKSGDETIINSDANCERL